MLRMPAEYIIECLLINFQLYRLASKLVSFLNQDK